MPPRHVAALRYDAVVMARYCRRALRALMPLRYAMIFALLMIVDATRFIRDGAAMLLDAMLARHYAFLRAPRYARERRSNIAHDW